MIDPLTERLEKARLQAGFSIADLARWLTVPWATVRTWCQHSATPRDHRVELIEERVGWLEAAIKRRDFLPLPLNLARDERPAYVARLLALYERRANHGRARPVSSARAAR